MTPSEATLVCSGLSYAYPTADGEVSVLCDCELIAEAGSFTAVAGPSGSGKSTLLRLLACFENPDTGSIRLDGVPISGRPARGRVRTRRTSVGFVRQAPAENLIAYLTVAEHLRLAARIHRTGDGRAAHEELLAALDLTALHNRRPRELSGGEQQRAAIAFAAAGRPRLLVADEPTGQLDHDHVASVVDALQAVAAGGVAIIAATHDPLVWHGADRVLWLRDGRLEADASAGTPTGNH